MFHWNFGIAAWRPLPSIAALAVVMPLTVPRLGFAKTIAMAMLSLQPGAWLVADSAIATIPHE